MSSQLSKERAHVCSFTYSDGRRCRSLCHDHPALCPVHARKEAKVLARQDAAEKIARCIPAGYLSANDLNATLTCLFAAVAHGHIPSRAATTLAYLGQTLSQNLHRAEHEYTNAFGSNTWRQVIRDSFASRDACPPPEPDRPATPPRPLPATFAQFRAEVLGQRQAEALR